jgi:hypothetical protein
MGSEYAEEHNITNAPKHLCDSSPLTASAMSMCSSRYPLGFSLSIFQSDHSSSTLWKIALTMAKHPMFSKLLKLICIASKQRGEICYTASMSYNMETL